MDDHCGPVAFKIRADHIDRFGRTAVGSAPTNFPLTALSFVGRWVRSGFHRRLALELTDSHLRVLSGRGRELRSLPRADLVVHWRRETPWAIDITGPRHHLFLEPVSQSSEALRFMETLSRA